MSLPAIRPGDTVLDLACGPAGMLALARNTLDTNQIKNVTLTTGDIINLSAIDTASVNCVLCTMSLHHLPDTAAMHKTMQEIRRLLKPGGGVYLTDFGRLKRTTTQRFFAFDRIKLQSEQFTADFLNSMRAAFSVEKFKAAIDEIGMPIQIYKTALAPFMLIARSDARRPIDNVLATKIKLHYENLMQEQQRDFDNMARWFRVGGLPLPCAI